MLSCKLTVTGPTSSSHHQQQCQHQLQRSIKAEQHSNSEDLKKSLVFGNNNFRLHHNSYILFHFTPGGEHQ